MLIAILFWTMCIAACGYGVALGGWEGKWTTAVFMFASLATMGSDWGLQIHWQETNLLVFLIDITAFLGLYLIAAKSHRWWPIWVAAFQLNTIVAHVATVLSPEFSALVYRGFESLWAIPCMLVMVFGVFRDRLWKYRYEFA